MRAFACPKCRSLVFFENDRCVTCDSEIGFDRNTGLLELAGTRCSNHVAIGCNWLTAGAGLCDSCVLTRTRPNDADDAGLAAWALTESAKRRLVYQLDRLGLPVTGRELIFDLLSSEFESVTTGHADGVVTIDLAEGADPHREAMRVKLAEPYRTMLGHLRHEVGHWYWTVLVKGTPLLDRFRDLFGDERADYADALAKHYGTEAAQWKGTHVSHYAAAHPWEDWAESFAHYLHITDTLETAGAWGVHTDGPDLDLSLAWDAQLDVDLDHTPDDFDEIARTWIALQLVLNQLNRSMGKGDLYPFRLNPAVLEKLRFVHVAVTSYRPGL